MLLRNNQTTPTNNDSLDLSLFDDLTFNDLENGVKGKHFQVRQLKPNKPYGNYF